ncbi:MAG: hypothetical protein DDT21_01867 [Syntrophomonadaceae bacterium]|nr:hypothetical protein [Bacillota bacterium]
MAARTTTTLPSTVLTTQEKKILDILCQTGESDAYIAAKLVVSVRTVTTHFCNISQKLEINGRCKLLLYWQRHRPQ